MKSKSILYIILLLVLPFKGIAARRSSEERIDALREETSLDKLLEAPAANCNRICSLFMTDRNQTLENSVNVPSSHCN